MMRRHARLLPLATPSLSSRRHIAKRRRLRAEKMTWQTHHEWDESRYGTDIRDAHKVLGTRVNDTLGKIKLKYLLQCRQHHPEVGGDPAFFYKLALAYEQILLDRGVECRDGRIVHSDTVPARRKLLTAGDATALIEERGNVSPVLAAALYAAEVKEAEQQLLVATGGEQVVVKELEEGEVAPETAQAAADEARSQEIDAAATKAKDAEAKGAEPKEPAAEVLTKAQGDGVQAQAGGAGTALEKTEATAEGGDADADKDLVVKRRVHIKPPEDLMFHQQALMKKLDDQMLEDLWNVAADELSHDEEEAVAREVIERRINSGRSLTLAQEEFLMTHLIERSESVAAEAARSATECMNNTEEKRQIMREGLVLSVLVLSIVMIAVVLAVAYARFRYLERKNNKMVQYLNVDTMLPWWGNDEEYEKQVKRLFVEEWRRARGEAQKQTTFNDGLTREGITDETTKHQLDLEIFDVTPGHLDKLRARVHRVKAANLGEDEADLNKAVADASAQQSTPQEAAPAEAAAPAAPLDDAAAPAEAATEAPAEAAVIPEVVAEVVAEVTPVAPAVEAAAEAAPVAVEDAKAA